MAVGVPIGVVLASALGVEQISAAWLVTLAALITPTFIQPFLQRKAFKFFSRACAGAFSGAYGVMWGTLLLDFRESWPAFIGSAVLFVVGAKGLLWLRARFPNNPCLTCPLGVYPTCSWNMERLLAGADPLLREALASGQVEVLGRDNR